MASVKLSEVKDFDELNRLVGYEISVPIDEFYEPMKLSKKQKWKRQETARKIEDMLIDLFAILFLFQRYGTGSYEEQVEIARERYITIVEQNTDAELTPYMASHAEFLFADMLEKTFRHSDEAFYYSADRARAIAENDSNSIWNNTEYEGALKGKNPATGRSYRNKTWNTIIDGKERDSHAAMNGVTIPINAVFHLAGGDCYYPRDDSLGMSDEEICSCRCSLTFS